MERNRSYSNGKKHWKHSKNNGQKNEKKSGEQEEVFLPKLHIEPKTCAYCGQPIEDMANAMGSRENGEPVHFDCVIKKLNESENLKPDEKITYLGGGKFGVVCFPNPQDLCRFEIHRTIEWENRDAKYKWRSEISDMFSSIK